MLEFNSRINAPTTLNVSSACTATIKVIASKKKQPMSSAPKMKSVGGKDSASMRPPFPLLGCARILSHKVMEFRFIHYLSRTFQILYLRNTHTNNILTKYAEMDT